MILGLALLVGCADKADDTAAALCEGAPRITWASHGEGLINQWCEPCHASGSANRHGAPEGVSFDTEAEALAWKDRILAVTALPEPTMPPGIDLPDEDRIKLELWLTCYAD